MTSPLTAIAIFEKDVNNDIIQWCFPTLNDSLQAILLTHCGLNDAVDCSFHYGQFQNQWYYTFTLPLQNFQTKVTNASCIVLSSVFNPERYKTLLSILFGYYHENCSPLPLLSAYLQVFTSGNINRSPSDTLLDKSIQSYKDSDFNDRKASIGATRSLVELLGQEIIIVWVAVLLKKRIFVYSPSLVQLQPLLIAVPSVGAWHRQSLNILHPYIKNQQEDIDDLKTSGIYIAGTIDSSFKERRDLWDIFIDTSSIDPANPNQLHVTINDAAKNDFTLTKFHKTTTETILNSLTADATNDVAMIKVISNVTQQLLTNLQSLATPNSEGVQKVSWEHLQTVKLPANMDKFLYNVATAEGMATK
jgi:hypothetical protein